MNYLEELFSLKNKIIIVTGASRGIDFDIATCFSNAGATVIGVGRTENIETNAFDYYPVDIRDQNKFKDLCNSLYKKPGLSENEHPVKSVTYSVIKYGLIGLTKYLATY